MKLKNLKKEELIFDSNNDRIFTKLILDDYDWFDYKIETKFYTKKLGILNIKFNYFGCNNSEMIVNQFIDNIIINHSYCFPTDIFKKNICKYMKAHIESWNEEYAFCGEDYVLDFYNEFITYCSKNKNGDKNE